MDGFLFQAFVYLCAAVIAVPVAKRLGLGSVLGYLIAGIIIGPVLHIVGSETEQLQHFAELGVVLMLFLIGLELQPRVLWQMRTRLLGLGGLQVLATAVSITMLALPFVDWRSAVAIGLILSLSSTAIVLQTLDEKGLARTEGGRSALSVLLFQDIAVIPMLALIPLLALPAVAGLGHTESAAAVMDQGAHGATAEAISLVANLDGWAYALVVLGAVAAIILGGHFLTRPLFRFIAASRLREIFTAAALLLVLGIALLMSLVDLSPALGTFLAGVVLADSEFRHELEADIEPFKGLLLGLFFITVGAGIDFGVLSASLLLVIVLTVGLLLLKGAILFALTRLFRLASGDRWLFTLALAQAGEFGFVLLGFSVQNSVLPPELGKILNLVIALSMLLTPALFILYEHLVLPRLSGDDRQPADRIDEQGVVIIAGIGRFGQIVNRMLVAAGVRTVVLDHDAVAVERMRNIGIRSYFGDACRPDLLVSAGIEDAKAFVIAIDDRDRAVELAEYLHREHPHVRLIARAYDMDHLYLLKKAGVDKAVREVFESSLKTGGAVLRELGIHPFRVEKMLRAFRRHDEASVSQLYELWDEHVELSKNLAMLEGVRARTASEQDALSRDRADLHDRSERGWTPPPKGYADDLDP
jgi:monovalent cation:proton antiporter-2 (CPA2) family protein